MQTWQDKPLPSAPARSIATSPLSMDPRYTQKDALSPHVAFGGRRSNPSYQPDISQRPGPPPSTAPQTRPHSTQPVTDSEQWVPHGQSKYMIESIYRRVMDENLAVIQNSSLRPWNPPPRQFAQPSPPPPLPPIAYAGSRPTSPSDEESMPPVSRFASAPAVVPPCHPAKHRLRPADSQPVVDWRRLPPSVLECIFDQLRVIHLGRRSRSCNTCHMRDLSALELTCKAWSAYSMKELYSSIAIVGVDSALKLRKLNTQRGARLILLRRTLRRRPILASLVTKLHVPDPIIPLYLPDGHPNPDYDDYLCLLASLVMACPNLELFTGFYPFYNHTFDRLTHALSTRTKLSQHIWIIAENDEVSARSQKQLPPGLLDPLQDYQFRQYHSRWSNLETLMLCSPGALGVLEHEVFVEVLNNLPNLKHLCVSSFDADDFNDRTLAELPRLISLRLEECEGVTDVGLAKWAASPSSVLLQRLTLIHQNLTSLVTISRLFSGLDSLKKFSILQSDLAPALPLDMVVFQPFFANKTVERIHWDVGEDVLSDAQDPDVNVRDIKEFDRITPNTHLALSILHHGFPALRNLRAPRDTTPPGILQSVCCPAPNANILLPVDKYSKHAMSPSPKSNSLQAARLRAQKLINKAIEAKKEYMKIVITDHADSGLRYDAELEQEEECSRESSKSSRERSGSTSTELTEPEITELLNEPGGEEGMGRRWRGRKEEEKSKTMTGESTTFTMVPAPTQDELRNLAKRNLPQHDSQPSPPPPSAQKYRPHSSRHSPHILSAQSRSSPSPIPSLSSASSTITPRNQTSHHQHHHYQPPSPQKVTEFSLPTFIGRISIHISSAGEVMFPAKPPRFNLLPDHFHLGDGVVGRDEMGGLAMWGQLLRVSKRERVARTQAEGKGEEEEVVEEEWKQDGSSEEGCTGSWNRPLYGRGGGGQGRGKGKRETGEDEGWRHVERERVGDLFAGGAGVREVVVEDFF